MSQVLQRRPLPSTIPPELTHFPPLWQRIFAARNIQSPAEIDYNIQRLEPFKSLSSIDAAAELLHHALEQQANILIVADYDADGATSCALAMRALHRLGAQHVHYIVPNREKHGYGLTPEIIPLTQAHQPHLLITVDNGISSLQGVIAAKAQNIQVLVTDHHLPPATLPPADAIVNPNLNGDLFPSKNLAGVGVIFYVMLALRARLRQQGWFERHALPVPNFAELLDLVALGTVADVVGLDQNNRILVEQGLQRLRNGRGCAGINALAKVARRNLNTLTTTDLAFGLAPRLNAAGRMDDMSYGISCLLCDEPIDALEHAQLLDQFNQERQVVEADMLAEALEKITELTARPEYSEMRGICLFDPQWHAGVIGILASRLKDRLHRPVIVFTQTENGELRGSGRSVAGVHIRDVLATLQAQHGLLLKFGGHAMAAGLSLAAENFNNFSQLFNEAVQNLLSPEQLQQCIYTDGELTAEDFTLATAETIAQHPWGQHFPAPIFEGVFEVLEWRVLKEKHLKLKLRPLKTTLSLDAIAFFIAPQHDLSQVNYVRLAYSLTINEFRDNKTLQLKVEYLESCVIAEE